MTGGDREESDRRLQRARLMIDRAATGGDPATIQLVQFAVDAFDTVVTAWDGDNVTAARQGADLEARAAALGRTDIFIESGVMAGAACLINLARPAEALVLMARVSQHREFYRLADFGAVAHLALGHVEWAIEMIRAHATRGLSGRLSREASDSVMLLGALADHEGDRSRAVDLLLHSGHCRSIAVITLARGFARHLGVGEEYAARERDWRDPQRMRDHGVLGGAVGMATLRSEMARRGWC